MLHGTIWDYTIINEEFSQVYPYVLLTLFDVGVRSLPWIFNCIIILDGALMFDSSAFVFKPNQEWFLTVLEGLDNNVFRLIIVSDLIFQDTMEKWLHLLVFLFVCLFFLLF